MCHVWDRGFAGTPWLFQVLETDLRFVLRWAKRHKLLDPWGERRKTWEIARGKGAWSSYYLYDPKSKERRKASVLAISVTHAEHARPLLLVVARLKGSKEPWYLLTSDIIGRPTMRGAWFVRTLDAGRASRPGATTKASWAVRARGCGPGSGGRSFC